MTEQERLDTEKALTELRLLAQRPGASSEMQRAVAKLERAVAEKGYLLKIFVIGEEFNVFVQTGEASKSVKGPIGIDELRDLLHGPPPMGATLYTGKTLEEAIVQYLKDDF